MRMQDSMCWLDAHISPSAPYLSKGVPPAMSDMVG